jgi:hypothetical protein
MIMSRILNYLDLVVFVIVRTIDLIINGFQNILCVEAKNGIPKQIRRPVLDFMSDVLRAVFHAYSSRVIQDS